MSDQMTMAEVKREIQALQDELLLRFKDFEEKTGASIDTVYIDRQNLSMLENSSILMAVQLRVEVR